VSGSNSPAHDPEESAELQLDFSKLSRATAQGPDVIPVAVQNADTKEVILVAYTNEQAFQRSATFWSTSRQELWVKGATSGNPFEVIEIRVNCEQNSPLYLVRPKRGGICHTRNSHGMARDCYYRRLDMDRGVLINQDP
jgi:phosphoribosyl-AMP cyclohydrolase